MHSAGGAAVASNEKRIIRIMYVLFISKINWNSIVADAQRHGNETQLIIRGALCKSSSIPSLVPHHKILMTTAARVPCSNAANIRELNPVQKNRLSLSALSVKSRKRA